MVSKEILAFCCNISPEDLKKLPFQRPKFEEVSNSWLVNQARSYQLAKSKLPSWWAAGNLVFPDPEALEQCTSEWVARWKQTLIPGSIQTLIDLTAGTGVDAFYLGKNVKNRILVEFDSNRAESLKANFLTLEYPVQLESTDALSFLSQNPLLLGKGTLVYLDPDRRGDSGQRLASWKETVPNLRQVINLLQLTNVQLIAKLSPLDNPDELIRELPGIHTVYTVSLHNEVKELLLIWHFSKAPTSPERYAAEVSRTGIFRIVAADHSSDEPVVFRSPEPGDYIYDPWAALRKNYQTARIPKQFGVNLFSTHSQLFTGPDFLPDFPGRIFITVEVLIGLKAFGQQNKGKAISVVSRGKVESAEIIKKKFGFTDGGEDYLFCLQGPDNKTYYLLARRVEVEKNPTLWEQLPD